uniref:Protein SWT21 n=1 Tax=Anthurium amnicola TaxID=1678845 RepID=A0A1D1XGL5_9ARAE
MHCYSWSGPASTCGWVSGGGEYVLLVSLGGGICFILNFCLIFSHFEQCISHSFGKHFPLFCPIQISWSYDSVCICILSETEWVEQCRVYMIEEHPNACWAAVVALVLFLVFPLSIDVQGFSVLEGTHVSQLSILS